MDSIALPTFVSPLPEQVSAANLATCCLLMHVIATVDFFGGLRGALVKGPSSRLLYPHLLIHMACMPHFRRKSDLSTESIIAMS
jgi:hypothetical protein